MKSLIFALTILLSTNILKGAELDFPSTVESVTIYHSGALVQRRGLGELNPGINELVLSGISSKIVLNSVKFTNKGITILNKTLVRKLSTEEYNQLIDERDALRKQIDLVESKYAETGFVASVEDLEKMTKFYGDKMLDLRKSLRDTENKLRQADKLMDVILKDENAAILRLTVSVDGQLKDPPGLQYVCGGIGWSPSYEIYVANSSDKSMRVKYLAKVMSQTGENWTNIVVNLSSSFPLEGPTSLPRANAPWTITGSRYTPEMPEPSESEGENSEQQQIQRLEGVRYEMINVPSDLQIRSLEGVFSIEANSTVFTFPITEVSLPATYHHFGFPGLDPESYLVSEVTDWSTLGFVDGMANITYAGNDIGKSIIRFSESMDTLLIAVGKDNRVFLKRTEMANEKFERGSSSSRKRKVTLAYQYEVKNNHPHPIKYELVDQFPLSQTKLASVELVRTSNGSIDQETGEMTWVLELNPGESARRELVFTIDIDADYRYFKPQYKPKFRTIACPSF